MLHLLDLGTHGLVTHGDDNLLQRLAHAQVALLAQSEDHRADLLGQLHALLESFVDHLGMILGEAEVMHALHAITVGDGIEVEEHALAEEGSDGGHEAAEGLEAGI